MQQLTPNEIYRTAYKYIENDASYLGEGLPHGINQVCPSCKAGSMLPDGKIAGSVEQVRDAALLKPFSDFYKTFSFAVYNCNSCGAVWSWYKE